MDITILSNLCEKAAAKPHIARRFGQLYSYIMQKYIMDIKGEDFLSADQKKQLASVLGEIEKSCLGEQLNMPQRSIRQAVGRGDYMTLLIEHSKLLGDETRPGSLAEKLKFQYQAPGGIKTTAPLTFPPRPSS